MDRTRSSAMRKVVNEHKRCELCGSKRELQAHHIIPIVFNGLDEELNILCVCKKCHSLLTPHSLLTRVGLKNLKFESEFYRHFHDLSDAGERYTAADVMDYLDEHVFPLMKQFSSCDTQKDNNGYRQIGQKKGAKLTTKKSIRCKEIIKKQSKDFDGDMSDAEMMVLLGIARGTYYKYKRELRMS